MSTARVNVEQAVAALSRGELVAFPTETVYGLGADATNPEALAKLYAVKGRPTDHPVILHLGDPSWLDRYAHPSKAALDLTSALWPGPLTVILPRTQEVPDQACGGQSTVGLRMPSHPMALELLRAFGKPLAAPSANRFGRISPTRVEHVQQDLGSSIAGVLDGGPCLVGVESTIVDLTCDPPAVLRPGGVLNSELEALLGRPLGEPGGIRAPGRLKSHYAPQTPCRLVSSDQLGQQCQGAAVLALQEDPGLGALHWLQAPTEPEDYARSLYANLRQLDGLNAPAVLVEEVPTGEAWAAVRDRLLKATASRQ